MEDTPIPITKPIDIAPKIKMYKGAVAVKGKGKKSIVVISLLETAKIAATNAITKKDILMTIFIN